MLSVIKKSLSFMTPREKRLYFWQLLGRCAASILDLLGVIAIGYLGTSAVMFLTKGSDSTRAFRIFGIEIPAANIHVLPFAVSAVLVLFIAKAVVSISITKFMATHLATIEARAAKVITKSVLGGNLEQSRIVSKEELLFAITTGASSAFTGVFNNLATLVSEGFLFLALVVTFLLVDPISTVGVLAYFGAVAWGIQWFTGKKLSQQSKVLVENAIVSNAVLNDLLAAFRELAVFGRRDVYFSRVEETRRASARAYGAQLYLVGMPRYVVETSVLVGVLAFGGYKLLYGDLASSVTTIAVFFTGSMRIIAAMLPWQAALVNIKTNFPQARVAHQFIPAKQSESASASLKTGSLSVGAPCRLQVDGVSYRYPGSQTEALTKVSLDIPAGLQVAFIGASGSGKSTLADLIMGLAEPTSGSILVNGVTPTEAIEKHPGLLAYVPQSPGIVSGSIEKNIALLDIGKMVDSHEAERAAGAAHMSSFVSALKDRLNTDLGVYHDSLSGGQLQRIGLARALYANPGLVIMDEATSALDADSESEIGRTLELLRGRTTVILIAHRLHTVQKADIVVLLAAGKIADVGTFKEILERNPSVSRAADLMEISR